MIDTIRSRKLLAVLLGLAWAGAGFAQPFASNGAVQEHAGAGAHHQEASQVQSQASPAGKDQARPGVSETVAEPSLADLARAERSQRSRESSRPARLFTNDNLPRGAGGLSIIGSLQHEDNGEATAEEKAETAGRLTLKIADLKERLETHQRELGVLQQKLGENQVQFYPNPNDILRQEYSREDIDRLTQAIDQKRQQVEADQQALAEAQDEVARRGLSSAAEKVGQEHGSPPKATPEAKKDSEEYWRLRFKAAREALAKAQEQQKLAEDELGLLKSQQAHELANGGAAAFESGIGAKQSEVESKQTAVEQAQHELESLEEEFKTSGAPQAWSQSE